MIVESTVVLPPLIQQFFSRTLLSLPIPKCRDSCHTIERMLAEVNKMWKRLRNNPQRLTRCEKLKEEILELYERAKIKEKEREAEEDHKTQEFGYHVAYDQALDGDVLSRLMFGRKSGSFKHKFRPDNAFSKIRRARR
jgi:hypothetical protein